MEFDGEFDIFISYSHADQGAIDQFTNIMKAFGYKIWRDAEAIPYGRNIRQMIADGQAHCNAFCCWVTASWRASDYCNRELDAALALGAQVVNIVVDGEPPALMHGARYLQFSNDIPETCFLLHRQLRESCSARAREHLDGIRQEHAVRAAAFSLQRMVELYDSRAAFEALCEAVEMDHASLNSLDHCFYYFRIAFVGRPHDAMTRQAMNLLERVLAGDGEDAIDKAAYTVGQLYLDARNPEMKDWARRLVRRLARKDGLVGDKMAYTKRRVGL